MRISTQADAVIFPQGMFSYLRESLDVRMPTIRDTFAPLLGTGRLTASVQLGFTLLTRESDRLKRSLLYSPGHPRAGDERYEWSTVVRDQQREWIMVEPVGSFWDAPGQVLVGWLKPDPAANPRALREISEADQEMLEYAARPENRLRKLGLFRDIGHINQEEFEDEVRRQGLEGLQPAAAPQIIVPGSVILGAANEPIRVPVPRDKG